MCRHLTICVLSLIAIIASALFAGEPTTKPVKAKQATTSFTEDESGFRLDYPFDWKKGDSAKNDRIKIAIIPPDANHDAKVSFMENPTKLEVGDLHLLHGIGPHSDTRFPVTVIEDSKVQLDGVDMFKVVCSVPASEDCGAEKFADWITIKDGRFYEIQFEASDKMFDQHLPAVEEMMKSFHWIDPPKK